MNKLPVFFFPALGRDHAPKFLPDDVLFMLAGLDDCGPAIFKDKLPFSPQEARMVLDEMLNLGFNLGPQAAFGQKTPFLGPNVKDRELKAIQNFTATGVFSPEPDLEDAKNLVKVRQDCQKVLLLAWELEKRRFELSDIENTYLEKAKQLRDALSESGGPEYLDGETDAFDHSGKFSLPGGGDGFDTPQKAPDWRAVASAGLAFLPEGAILLTDSQEVVDELSEIEALGPLPNSVANALAHWPKDFLAGLSYACLPGWKLTGRGKRADAWPWLKRETGILVFSTKTSGAQNV